MWSIEQNKIDRNHLSEGLYLPNYKVREELKICNLIRLLI